MKSIAFILGCLVIVSIVSLPVNLHAQDDKKPTLESLLGKYEGHMQIFWTLRPLDYSYKTEIVSVDKAAKTLSLTAYCQKCEVSEWTRDKCVITEMTEKISFVCKGTYADEKYTYKDGKLLATGYGKKYPFSIDVTKVDK